MKKYFFLGIILCSLSTNIFSQNNVRLKQIFDFDWQFHFGDDANAVKKGFVPKEWEWKNIQLPHDFSIIQDFDKKVGGSAGYLPGGIGLYRKEFYVPSTYRGKIISIIFDGVYHNATIYLNGEKIGSHRYGYTSFKLDMTEHLHYGKTNVLLVRVNRTEVSRWYTGSGIYRHTWLQVTNPIHVKTWGTYVTMTDVNKESAHIKLSTTIVNQSKKDEKIKVSQFILDENKNLVIQNDRVLEADSVLIVQKTSNIEQFFKLNNPHLWSIETPTLYTVKTVISEKGRILDTYYTQIGIRNVRFDAKDGFFLNGKNLKLKGVCLHQDAGCLGVAVPKRSYERRLEILKEFGCNAIRCSHNPPAPEFLDLCDKMGFLVLDEAFDKWKSGYYEKYFDQYWKQDIHDMIERDRNHPSIIMWSIGNEVSEASLQDNTGIDRAKMLRDYVHEIEPTKPVMIACQNNFNDAFGDVPDILGYNYMETRLIKNHKDNPNKIRFVSEAFPYFSSDNNHIREYLDKNPWNYVKDNKFILGAFIWAGVDYLGESSWPLKGWVCSLFDMCLFERTASAYHRSVWNEEPMVRIAVVDPSQDIAAGKDHWQFPTMVHHWNFPYTDERVLEIRTMTNCDKVKLIAPDGYFKADFALRSSENYQNQTIKWNIPYRKGKVLAIAYNNGVEVCRDSIVTSGNTYYAKITPDRNIIKADGQDLSYITISLYDENNIPVQIDDRMITVSVEGEGKFLGIENGDFRRQKSFQGNKLKTYFGKSLVIIQSNRKPGLINVKIHVQGIDKLYTTKITSK
ncbi:MAG: glycoside hydrolase family 2 TIM barrel-domain containing protein [Bacteroidales bacterium]